MLIQYSFPTWKNSEKNSYKKPSNQQFQKNFQLTNFFNLYTKITKISIFPTSPSKISLINEKTRQHQKSTLHIRTHQNTNSSIKQPEFPPSKKPHPTTKPQKAQNASPNRECNYERARQPAFPRQPSL